MDSLIESTQIVRDPSQTLWTPARNVVLIAAAAAYAEAEGAELITWGANQSETAYPDNTMEFADRFSYMLEMGCLKPAKVTAPLYHLDKPEMVLWTYRHGYEKVYLHTWSCDRGIPNPVLTEDRKYIPCGECGCCMNRRLAFMIAHNSNEFVVDTQTYNNPDYFKNKFLPDLLKRCTPDMWMHKYLKLIGG
jgi:7-cyano-7-deazaguanine synthase in queuosine biosynthesis